MHNTGTVTHSDSYSTEHKKEVHYTLVHTWYTTITAYTTFTAVHNTCMTQKHLGYLEVKLLQRFYFDIGGMVDENGSVTKRLWSSHKSCCSSLNILNSIMSVWGPDGGCIL